MNVFVRDKNIELSKISIIRDEILNLFNLNTTFNSLSIKSIPKLSYLISGTELYFSKLEYFYCDSNTNSNFLGALKLFLNNWNDRNPILLQIISTEHTYIERQQQQQLEDLFQIYKEKGIIKKYELENPNNISYDDFEWIQKKGSDTITSDLKKNKERNLVLEKKAAKL
ncbi:unnamed protein product [Rhizophagus irregularis]|nr:unnamed protein product [Rhizophagus irregularis]